MKGGELIKGEDKVKTDLKNILYENVDEMKDVDWKVINIVAYYFLKTEKTVTLDALNELFQQEYEVIVNELKSNNYLNFKEDETLITEQQIEAFKKELYMKSKYSGLLVFGGKRKTKKSYKKSTKSKKNKKSTRKRKTNKKRKSRRTYRRK
jgi:hypothetical protein